MTTQPDWSEYLTQMTHLLDMELDAPRRKELERQFARIAAMAQPLMDYPLGPREEIAGCIKHDSSTLHHCRSPACAARWRTERPGDRPPDAGRYRPRESADQRLDRGHRPAHAGGGRQHRRPAPGKAPPAAAGRHSLRSEKSV